jgi:hypothetical protein
MREMSLTVERFREATDGGLQSMGAWVYGIGARPEGPIVIEGLKDAILRYFDGSPASGERDRVNVCRDDLIEPEPLWGQFVETYFKGPHVYPRGCLGRRRLHGDPRGLYTWNQLWQDF